MELGEAKQSKDIQTALLDAVQLAFWDVDFEPTTRDPGYIEDENNKFLSGSERHISGYDIVSGRHIYAAEYYIRELFEGEEYDIRAIVIEWDDDEMVLFDLDSFIFSWDGENEYGKDSTEFSDSCRKTIDGLMVCTSNI